MIDGKEEKSAGGAIGEDRNRKAVSAIVFVPSTVTYALQVTRYFDKRNVKLKIGKLGN